MIFTLQISVMLNYGKIVVEEFVKELKLINVVAISWYWQSWRPYHKVLWWSQRFLRQSMTIDWPVFYVLYIYTYIYIYIYMCVCVSAIISICYKIFCVTHYQSCCKISKYLYFIFIQEQECIF